MNILIKTKIDLYTLCFQLDKIGSLVIEFMDKFFHQFVETERDCRLS